MSTTQLSGVLASLRRSAVLQNVVALTDGELLRRYVADRDQTAFEMLVQRHGPMVLGVCRRLVANRQDAEDVFQATFLVLVRKAATVQPGERVGNWLYGVAHHAAQKVRANNTRRQAREKQVRSLPEPATLADGFWRDLEPLLDRELSRLPEKYRLPIVLCDLEGRTRSEAARQLGWPEGTVAGRLARGRSLLAKRLTCIGLPLSAGVLSALLSQNARAAVPFSLICATVQMVAGVVAAPVTALTKGVMTAMFYSKLRIILAVMLTLAMTGSGAAWLSRAGGMPQDEPKPPAKPSRTAPASSAKAKEEKPKEKADDVAWGKAVGGLQAGIGYKVGAKRPYQLGEAVPLVILLHNVSDRPIQLEYYDGFFAENPPSVTDADGKPATLSPFPIRWGKPRLLHLTLEADETIELGTLDLNLAPIGSKAADKPTLYAAPGRYRIGYSGLLPNGRGDVSKLLATGHLELEIRETDKPQGKAAEISWGKTMDGLQAGIACQRSYAIGEKAAFAVKVRNVSEKKVMLTHYSVPFDGVRPIIEDSGGKPLHVIMPPLTFYFPIIRQRNLEPGEVFEIGTPQLQFATVVADGKVSIPTVALVPGTYRVSYPAISAWVGSGPDMGTNRLSTGKATMEVARPKAAAKNELDGMWEFVSFKQDGRDKWSADELKEMKATFQNGNYRLPGSWGPQGSQSGTFKLDPAAKPKTIDLTGKSGVAEGWTFRGIYKVEDDTLTLCFSWPVRDRPIEFGSPPNSTVVLVVFKRK